MLRGIERESHSVELKWTSPYDNSREMSRVRWVAPIDGSGRPAMRIGIEIERRKNKKA